MCGILGYVGGQNAVPILVEGLRRLEYRGYDSAGLSLLVGEQIRTVKRKGRIDNLEQALLAEPLSGTCGISHTRWATHGEPSDINSHPHSDQSGRLSLVHNGVIENYAPLREALEQKGHRFVSATDTEVLAHLVGEAYDGLAEPDGTQRLRTALHQALKQVIGTYGISVLHEAVPGVLMAARRGSPLLLGVGEGENFIASDASALIRHTRSVIYLNDYDVAVVTAGGYSIESMTSGKANREISRIEWESGAAEKGEFAHHMLKEIFEQPQTVRNALRGRINAEEATAVLGGLNMTSGELRAVDRILLIACGTSWHAGLAGEYIFEHLARIPVEVEYASELRYRNPPIEKNTLVFALSQSGETADTLAALRECRRKGHRTLGIINVVGSTIAREADGGIYMHAGPEVGVAATKTFTSQVTVLTLLALFMGRLRHLSFSEGKDILAALEQLPEQIQSALATHAQVETIAREYASSRSMLFLGRLYNFPAALEGALKLKEISYIHAEGYPSGEIKHGPIALIEPECPSVILIPHDEVFEKNLSNLEEIRARGGRVIALTTGNDSRIAGKADHVIAVPQTRPYLQPLINIIPLQLLAYHMAVARGCDVDKPRNLAKSVTVE
ncbi:MAG: glutamine--fructose-6-phosphate transaminase (isomerizing) [Verrucomicrobiae bacterium]|nr:glutamine--fructose-6-phosphate transaminase (isomerizing) [Verrucomicrobiae bacterium]